MVNRGDSYANLPYYESYDLAWLGPIVFPLGLSLISILLALGEGWFVAGGYFNTTTNTIATLCVAVEAFFAILCFIQCVLNFSQRAYVGLEVACDFQAWYSCFWIYCSIGMQVLVAYASRRVSRTRRQPPKRQVFVFVTTILVLALVLSLLPMMNVGYYGFLKDYCTFELHDPVMGGIFLTVYVLALLTISWLYIGSRKWLLLLSKYDFSSGEEGEEQDNSTTTEKKSIAERQQPLLLPTLITPAQLQILLAVFFFIIWTPTAVVVLLYQVGNLKPPGTSTESAWIALSLHSQQLLVPLLVGILWRRWAQDATSSGVPNQQQQQQQQQQQKIIESDCVDNA